MVELEVVSIKCPRSDIVPRSVDLLMIEPYSYVVAMITPKSIDEVATYSIICHLIIQTPKHSMN